MYTKEINARKTGIRIAGVNPRVSRRHTDGDGGRGMAAFSPTRAIAIRSLTLRVQSRRIPRPRDVAVLLLSHFAWKLCEAGHIDDEKS